MSTPNERQDHEAQYNGWKNYPTWAVNLWLSNDEGLYRETNHRARMALKARPFAVMEGWETDHAAVLANGLRDWVTDELAPNLGATFAADLLGYALGEVDWYEIAESWLKDLES